MLSFYFTATVALVASIGLAHAQYTTADMNNPTSGNPFSYPESGQNVVAGEEFNVTWTKTTEGTVTIYLCKGPSGDCQNQDIPIADKIPNIGYFLWTPSTELAASEDEGYGIQLVVDETRDYQYTNQFGIINDNPTSSSSASSSTLSSVVVSSTAFPTAASSTSTPSPTLTSTVETPTAIVPVNTLSSSTTSPSNTAVDIIPSPGPTGAAAHFGVGQGMFAGALLAAFALLR